MPYHAKRSIGCAAAVVAAVALASACSSSSSSPTTTTTAAAVGSGGCSNQVTVGAEESLSGAFSALGSSILGSAAVAVNDVNKTGFTVAGKCYKFNLVKSDAQSTPAGAALGATKLTQAGAKFIFGPTETPEALGCPARHQPGRGDVVHRQYRCRPVAVRWGDDLRRRHVRELLGVLEPAAGLSQNLAAESKILVPAAKTAALLLPATVTTAPYVKYLTLYLKQHGITVTKAVQYSLTATDYNSDLTAIKAAKPDLLITGTADITEVQTVAAEMETLGGVAKALLSTIGTPSIGMTGNNGRPMTIPFAWANTGSVKRGHPAVHVRLVPQRVQVRHRGGARHAVPNPVNDRLARREAAGSRDVEGRHRYRHRQDPAGNDAGKPDRRSRLPGQGAAVRDQPRAAVPADRGHRHQRQGDLRAAGVGKLTS